MKNTRLYKICLYSVFGVSIILTLAIVVYAVISRMDAVVIVGIIGLAFIGAGIAGIDHVRMRMMFEVLHRKQGQAERIQREESKRVETYVRQIGRDLYDTVPRTSDFSEAKVLARLDALEREIIANDSFNEARLNVVSRALDEINTAAADNRNLLVTGFESNQDHNERIRSEVSESLYCCANNIKEKAGQRLSALERLLDENRSAEERASSRLSSMISVINSNSRGSDEVAVEVREALGRIDLQIARSNSDFFEQLEEVGTKLNLVVTSETQSIRREDRIGAVEASVETGFGVMQSQWSDLSGRLDSVSRTVKRLQSELTSNDQTVGHDTMAKAVDVTQQSLSRLNDENDARFTKLAEQTQKFFNATQNKLEYQRAASEELPKDISDYAALLSKFRIDSTDAPDIGGWSATVPVICTLVKEILEYPSGLRSTLDVGSGTSTFWSALAMRERGEGKCVALEHNPVYAKLLRQRLRAHGLEQWAEVVDAPLITWSPQLDYPCENTRIPDRWYDTGQLEGEKFGLVFVDGPPGDSGVYSRLPALEELWHYLAEDAVIVLDDTIRLEEREIAEIWSRLVLPSGNVETQSHLLKSTVLRVAR